MRTLIQKLIALYKDIWWLTAEWRCGFCGKQVKTQLPYADYLFLPDHETLSCRRCGMNMVKRTFGENS